MYAKPAILFKSRNTIFYLRKHYIIKLTNLSEGTSCIDFVLFKYMPQLMYNKSFKIVKFNSFV